MKIKKILSIILLISTICSCALFESQAVENQTQTTPENYPVSKDSVPEILDYSDVEKSGHKERLYSEEKEMNSAVFLNEDGTKSLYVFTEDVKYTDKDGNVRDKSNRLSKIEGGFTNKSNDVNVFYPDQLSGGISVSFDKYSVSMTPVFTDGNYSAKLYASKDPADEGKDDKIVYENAFDTSKRMLYTQKYSGLKEEIIIESKIEKTDLSFSVSLVSLELLSDPEKLTLADSVTGEAVAELSPIIMWDSSGICCSGKYTVRSSSDKDSYIVTMDVSSIFEKNDLVYPVTIDPSLNIGVGSATAIEDATIYTNYSSNYGSGASLHVGNFNALLPNASVQRGTARSLVKFPGLMSNTNFNSYYNNGDILSVKYNFSDINCEVGPNTINAYMMTSNWNESTVVYSSTLWGAKSDYIIAHATISPVSPIPYPFPRYELDITTAVTAWKEGTSPNYGIMLAANNEALAAVMLGTSESGTGSVPGRTDSKPYVVATFTLYRENVIYRIKNVGSGLYLNAGDGFDKDNKNVFQSSLGTHCYPHEFRIYYHSTEDAYRIHPISSMNGRYRSLDVKKSGTGVSGLTSGCNLQIYKPTDDIANLFKIISVGSGAYKIVLKNATDLAITANGTSGGSLDGTSSSSTGNVYMSTYTGANSQKWILERSERNEEELYYSMMNIKYPFRGSNIPLRISSGFCNRVSPTGGETKYHNGIDIPASAETPLYSVFEGTVAKIHYEGNTEWGRGHFIIVEATNDYNSVYKSTTKLRYVFMHMIKCPTETNPNVDVGKFVGVNTLIGKVGKTGASTDYHLHLGIIINGGEDTSTTQYLVIPTMFYPDINFTY